MIFCQNVNAIIIKSFLFVWRISCCLIELLVLFQEGKTFEAKISFNLLVNFWTTVDENGSMISTVTEYEISILYYFNDENIDLENLGFKKVNNCLAVVNLSQYVNARFLEWKNRTLDQIMKGNKLTKKQKVAKFLKLILFHDKTLFMLVSILDSLF